MLEIKDVSEITDEPEVVAEVVEIELDDIREVTEIEEDEEDVLVEVRLVAEKLLVVEMLPELVVELVAARN